MVAKGFSGLHYPFTIETVHYMVEVLYGHFHTLFKYLVEKGHVPDQQHHAKDEFAVSIFSKKKQNGMQNCSL